jgi:hypothetical protein
MDSTTLKLSGWYFWVFIYLSLEFGEVPASLITGELVLAV